ncbi:MAG: VWA domain-containing protein [Terriglobales bacterium]
MHRQSWKALAPLLLVLAATPLVQNASAQTLKSSAPPSQEDDATVSFRSFSRMVLVDVVVKDGNGRAVSGLKLSDFELAEDGVPHQIASFSESVERRPRRRGAMSAELQDVYSNARPPGEEEVRPSIVLLDLLNTSVQDRPIARKALLKFVQERMQSKEPLAIFVLWNKLELLIDLTGDIPMISSVIASDRRTYADPKRDRMSSNMMRKVADLFDNPSLALISSPTDPNGIADAVYQRLAESTERIEDQFEAERAMTRVEQTLAALRAIARFAEKHRGRKSLVWLSAAFPFSIQTEFGVVDFDAQLRHTSNQLSTAQVAVYPVDVRGLTPVVARPLEDEISKQWLLRPDEHVPKAFQEAYHHLFDSQDTMKEIADLTGGVAYTNRNDLDVAIAYALEDNRETYTLGYYPLKKRFDSRFRRIKVKLKTTRHADLRYRRGYYATGFSIETRVSSDLLTALEQDATVSAQIPLLSRVAPAAPTANVPFQVEIFVKGGNIHYMDVANRSAAFLDFAAVALSPAGKSVARTWHRGELKLDPEKIAQAERSGLLYSLPINLPAGHYRIRAGIRDSFTGRIGTVEIPVVVK